MEKAIYSIMQSEWCVERIANRENDIEKNIHLPTGVSWGHLPLAKFSTKNYCSINLQNFQRCQLILNTIMN